MTAVCVWTACFQLNFGKLNFAASFLDKAFKKFITLIAKGGWDPMLNTYVCNGLWMISVIRHTTG